jgi:hydroxymethylglutaryl-CoA reductase
LTEKPLNSNQKFYNLTISERRKVLAAGSPEASSRLNAFDVPGGLTFEQADAMIENVVGLYALPVGVAQNFIINGRAVQVPMVIEEPSVVAGASFMAKLAQSGGGFKAEADPPVMIGQMQVLHVPGLESACERIQAAKADLIREAAGIDPLLVKLGGGLKDIQVRILSDTEIGPFLVVHLLIDVRDAMGANAVNTFTERLAPRIESLTGGKVHLRILSNLADHRLARASCTIQLEELAFDNYTAEEVRDGIIDAWAFADADPYRAATHNKGIMNGVDAVVLAVGNDWRAVEAGAHAYAARSGRYTSLSRWAKDAAGNLTGSLEMPMAVGIVGGATRVHPGAQAALALMGVSTASDLAKVIVSVGLAQNLAALRALATEGIQRGHMTLHARQVAIAAGAQGEQITRLADQMVKEKIVRIDRAEEILKEWSK